MKSGPDIRDKGYRAMVYSSRNGYTTNDNDDSNDVIM